MLSRSISRTDAAPSATPTARCLIVGATPTSSTPTTRSRPSRQRLRSNLRVGTLAAIGGKGTAARLATASGGAGPPFAKGCGLADALPQEVELGATRPAMPDDLDLVDARAVDLERALDPDAAGDLADRDRAGDP